MVNKEGEALALDQPPYPLPVLANTPLFPCKNGEVAYIIPFVLTLTVKHNPVALNQTAVRSKPFLL
jgi:hypothetical protein